MHLYRIKTEMGQWVISTVRIRFESNAFEDTIETMVFEIKLGKPDYGNPVETMRHDGDFDAVRCHSRAIERYGDKVAKAALQEAGN